MIPQTPACCLQKPPASRPILPTTASSAGKPKIAIIGGGVTGLSAAWALSTNHDVQVHVFESAEELGGCAQTVAFQCAGDMEDARTVDVDIGVMGFSPATSETFTTLLKHLGISTSPITNMTCSVTQDLEAKTLEWSPFSSIRNLVLSLGSAHPRDWRILLDILRFKISAWDLLSHPVSPTISNSPSCVKAQNITISSYLARNGYTPGFLKNYIIPLTTPLWSGGGIEPEDMLAVEIVRFMAARGMLAWAGEPGIDTESWMRIRSGGMRSVVEALVGRIPERRIHTGCRVTKVVECGEEDSRKWGVKYQRSNAGQDTVSTNRWRDSYFSDDSIEGEEEQDEIMEFDTVILAVPPLEATRMLTTTSSDSASFSSPTSEASHILDSLSPYATSHHTAVLHADTSLMPFLPSSWRAVNLSTNSITTTYNLNILQDIPPLQVGHLMVSIDPQVWPKHVLAVHRFTRTRRRLDVTRGGYSNGENDDIFCEKEVGSENDGGGGGDWGGEGGRKASSFYRQQEDYPDATQPLLSTSTTNSNYDQFSAYNNNNNNTNTQNRLLFAGAWTLNDTLEDACKSGLSAAQQAGATLPADFQVTGPHIFPSPSTGHGISTVMARTMVKFLIWAAIWVVWGLEAVVDIIWIWGRRLVKMLRRELVVIA